MPVVIHDVMGSSLVRTHIRLTEQQATELKRLATECGVSVAKIIREAVDQYLRESHGLTWEEKKRRALAVAGRFRGPGDLSERHDDYFAEATEE